MSKYDARSTSIPHQVSWLTVGLGHALLLWHIFDAPCAWRSVSTSFHPGSQPPQIGSRNQLEAPAGPQPHGECRKPGHACMRPPPWESRRQIRFAGRRGVPLAPAHPGCLAETPQRQPPPAAWPANVTHSPAREHRYSLSPSHGPLRCGRLSYFAHVDRRVPRSAGAGSAFAYDVDPRPQVLQIDGRRYHPRPCLPSCAKDCQQ